MHERRAHARPRARRAHEHARAASGSKRRCGTGNVLPLAVAKRADGACLQPARDAIKVEDVAAAAPRDRVAGVVGEAGVGLRLDGRLVQLVAANGARVCARERNKRGCDELKALAAIFAKKEWAEAAVSCAPVQMSQDQKVTAFLRRRRSGGQRGKKTGSGAATELK